MERTKITRIKKWKKYRESIYGFSFFYLAFFNNNKNIKDKISKLNKTIKSFDYENILNNEEIKNIFSHNDVKNNFNYKNWKIDNLKLKIQNLENNFFSDFSFLENINLEFDFLQNEKDRLNKIKIQNHTKGRNDKN
ncbi:hypothetical protein [Mesomycoplasma neurolyticum]|uniref:Uncharacterized protein n=1 Tax=Mesomycoplasma neurolyticum TaxID=2120 RepID=A0A449A655_9BACT|nr:hypothetical protein [Mesomycoplasma neurolyticum]VEU59709.1 Uncharacterised protein [Mesomycoplasma neurolyticum]